MEISELAKNREINAKNTGDYYYKNNTADSLDRRKWFAKIVSLLGAKFVTIKVTKENDKLFVSGYFGKNELSEYLPGLYFTDDGEAFDIRRSEPIFKNIKLRKYSDKQ